MFSCLNFSICTGGKDKIFYGERSVAVHQVSVITHESCLTNRASANIFTAVLIIVATMQRL